MTIPKNDFEKLLTLLIDRVGNIVEMGEEDRDLTEPKQVSICELLKYRQGKVGGGGVEDVFSILEILSHPKIF